MKRMGVVLVGALMLGGCGDASEGERSSENTPTASPSVDEPAPATPSPSVTSKPSVALPGGPGTTLLSGTAVRDDELRCWFLTDDSGAGYSLIGNIGGLISGARVTVQGRVDPGAMTTCQSGRVFVVTAVAR